MSDPLRPNRKQRRAAAVRDTKVAQKQKLEVSKILRNPDPMIDAMEKSEEILHQVERCFVEARSLVPNAQRGDLACLQTALLVAYAEAYLEAVQYNACCSAPAHLREVVPDVIAERVARFAQQLKPKFYAKGAERREGEPEARGLVLPVSMAES